MTGFGRAEQTAGEKTFLVDIKSLNSKQFELQLRIPGFLKPYEFDIRKLLSEKLVRGSVDCIISLKETGNAKPVTINAGLAKAYYQPLKDLAEDLNLDTSHILNNLLKLPEVITPSSETLSKEEWEALARIINLAINDLNKHRLDEGRILEKEVLERISNISHIQEDVKNQAPERQQHIRDELVKLLEENVGKENYDKNRLEQELIYYMDKIDITEEMVRLRSHCDYFNAVVKDPEESKGKKLSFIIQEIGREINTAGSKAYHAGIQKCVVLMKDEMEKAKEQIMNVL